MLLRIVCDLWLELCIVCQLSLEEEGLLRAPRPLVINSRNWIIHHWTGNGGTSRTKLSWPRNPLRQ